MFVRDFIHIERPFEAVAPRFVRDPAWLDPVVSHAVGEAAGLVPALAGSAPGGPDPAARCARGTVRRRAETLIVPMRWTVEDPEQFPAVEGDLTIAPVGPDGAQLSFDAFYRGAPTPDRDQLATHHAVEVAIRSFLRQVAGALDRTEAHQP